MSSLSPRSRGATSPRREGLTHEERAERARAKAERVRARSACTQMRSLRPGYGYGTQGGCVLPMTGWGSSYPQAQPLRRPPSAFTNWMHGIGAALVVTAVSLLGTNGFRSSESPTQVNAPTSTASHVTPQHLIHVKRTPNGGCIFDKNQINLSDGKVVEFVTNTPTSLHYRETGLPGLSPATKSLNIKDALPKTSGITGYADDFEIGDSALTTVTGHGTRTITCLGDPVPDALSHILTIIS